eukprot:8147444-Alexandrium_andersonii.AAC.1
MREGAHHEPLGTGKLEATANKGVLHCVHDDLVVGLAAPARAPAARGASCDPHPSAVLAAVQARRIQASQKREVLIDHAKRV